MFIAISLLPSKNILGFLCLDTFFFFLEFYLWRGVGLKNVFVILNTKKKPHKTYLHVCTWLQMQRVLTTHSSPAGKTLTESLSYHCVEKR